MAGLAVVTIELSSYASRGKREEGRVNKGGFMKAKSAPSRTWGQCTVPSARFGSFRNLPWLKTESALLSGDTMRWAAHLRCGALGLHMPRRAALRDFAGFCAGMIISTPLADALNCSAPEGKGREQESKSRSERRNFRVHLQPEGQQHESSETKLAAQPKP